MNYLSKYEAMQTRAGRLGAAARRLLVVALATSGCMTPSPPGVASGGYHDRQVDLAVFGLRRGYRVYLPPGFDGSRRLPLVVAVHGAFSSPSDFASVTGLDGLAAEEGFVVAYPAGFGPPLRHWNSGHCCGLMRALGVDDVGFLDTVIRDVQENFAVDPDRTFLVGHSNGGMLVHHFAARRPDRIAAAAVVAGTIGGRPSRDEPVWQVPAPDQPVPMLIVHGRRDERVLYDGGSDARSRGGRTWLSAAAAARFWSGHAGCSASPRRDSLHGGLVTREVWNGPPGCRVELQTVEGWGHAWPRGVRGPGGAAVSAPFDASRAVWDFFRELSPSRSAEAGTRSERVAHRAR